MDKRRKVYVEVEVLFDIDGRMVPKSIHWEDGRVYHIDKVLDSRRAASLKAGGQGIRYLCRIMEMYALSDFLIMVFVMVSEAVT